MVIMEQTTAKRGRPLNLNDAPAYTLGDAARYLRLPVPTLRSWVVGRPYPKGQGIAQFEPLISPPTLLPPLLSFWNLIEAHVLRSLRTDHGVSLKDVRAAIAYAERQLSVERLLLSRELSTGGGQIFLDRYGRLINLSASGQLALRKVFEEHLNRVEWDESKFPARLYPFLGTASERCEKWIAIDPKIAFGRPIVLRRGVSTQTIADRIDAGESVDELASDYDLEPSEIELAVLYERAA
jgi:uncharacterized protein (DUF433 family)